eukprot:m51a1_g7797 hypothetical protein (495) ;mRNA; r:46212-51134
MEQSRAAEINADTESASGASAEMSPASAAIEMALPPALDDLKAGGPKAPEHPDYAAADRSVSVRAHLLCMLACVALQTAALAVQTMEQSRAAEINADTESASGASAEMSPASAAIEMALPPALDDLKAGGPKAPEHPDYAAADRSVSVRAHLLCMLACVALQTAALAVVSWPATSSGWDECTYGLARPWRVMQTSEAFGIIADVCGGLALLVVAADTAATHGVVPGYPAGRWLARRGPVALWAAAAVSASIAVVVWPAFIASDKQRPRYWYPRSLDDTWLGLQVAATCLSVACCLCFAKALRRWITPSLLLASLALEVTLLSLVHWETLGDDSGSSAGDAELLDGARTASEALGVCAVIAGAVGVLETAPGALAAEGLVGKRWDFSGRHRAVSGLLCATTALLGLSATVVWSGAWRKSNDDVPFADVKEQATWLALQIASALAAVGAGIFCVPYNHWRHYLVPLALLAFAALQVSALAANAKWPTTGDVVLRLM